MLKSNQYLRQVGITKEQFSILLSRLEEVIANHLKENSLRRRGLKSKLSIEDQLLLTLTYLRQYPTFISLGSMFSISESYANKIYHRTINYMIKFIHPKKLNELSLDDVRTVVIDVAEQEIERPKKKQKTYYSGKKNVIQ